MSLRPPLGYLGGVVGLALGLPIPEAGGGHGIESVAKGVSVVVDGPVVWDGPLGVATVRTGQCPVENIEDTEDTESVEDTEDTEGLEDTEDVEEATKAVIEDKKGEYCNIVQYYNCTMNVVCCNDMFNYN